LVKVRPPGDSVLRRFTASIPGLNPIIGNMRAGHMNTESGITKINANGTQIAYERYGNELHPTILLIHGLGMPMTAWPMEMVKNLVAGGFQVLRIDNRDMGQSQKFDHLKLPNMLWQIIKHRIGFKVSAPYPLTDLMKDTVGVLDALKLDSVHVVGVSMGGMISQLLAINVPSRVKSLTSIMSHTGNKDLPGPTKTVSNHLLSKPTSNSEADRQVFHVKTWQLIGSPGYPSTAAQTTNYVCDQLERGISPVGTARQMLAILATPNRVPMLAKLKMPCQVIHGNCDPLIPVEGGHDTAKAIPHAKLHLIDGMGHDLPQPLHEQICGLILEQARATENNLQAAS